LCNTARRVACVRACAREGVAEISIWMRANCCSCWVGVGEAKYSPFTCLDWEVEGRLCGWERRIGGEEECDCTDCVYCTSPIERAGAFLVSSPCVLQLLLLWEGKAGREQVSKLSSFQAFTTNAGKLHRNTTRARLLLQSLPLTLCAHWPAAHRELISKHRHPTLASMPQRDVRAARS
jgi:hypothetical protein